MADKKQDKALEFKSFINRILGKLKITYTYWEQEKEWVLFEDEVNRIVLQAISLKEQEVLEINKDRKHWSSICATQDTRNQCSEKNCIIFPICRIKKPVEQATHSERAKLVEKIINLIGYTILKTKVQYNAKLNEIRILNCAEHNIIRRLKSLKEMK